MVYRWPPWALESLPEGIEAHEVVQALAARRRWPRLARSDTGVVALTFWARTEAGRPLLVAVRQVGTWDWEIVGARDLRADELAELEEWEATPR